MYLILMANQDLNSKEPSLILMEIQDITEWADARTFYIDDVLYTASQKVSKDEFI